MWAMPSTKMSLTSWHRRILIYAVIGGAVWAALCVIAYLASRRAAAEAALQQAQRMEAIGQLASGVAHDFNNVLTAVIGNLDLIALDQHATQRVRQLAEAALRAAHRGSSLTAQLLAFARRQPLQPRAVRVDGLLDGMLPLIKNAVGEMVSVSCKSSPDLSAVRV